jgi:hypothetical protein
MRSGRIGLIVALATYLVAVTPLLAYAAPRQATSTSAAAVTASVTRHAGVGVRVHPFEYRGSLRDLPTVVKHKGRSHVAGDDDIDDLEGRTTALSNGPRDPLLPTSTSNLPTSTGAMTAPIANFAGVGNVNGKIPPDTNGDVGISDYLQVVNDSFDIFSKATGNDLLGGAKATNSLWVAGAPSTRCARNDNGDAIARYDLAANRFVLTQFAFDDKTNGPWDECFAVSKTADPVAGGWFLYDFQVSTARFDDYRRFRPVRRPLV